MGNILACFIGKIIIIIMLVLYMKLGNKLEVKNYEKCIKSAKMSETIRQKDFRKFWKEVNKMKGDSKSIANNVDGVQGEELADLFADKCKNLSNEQDINAL